MYLLSVAIYSFNNMRLFKKKDCILFLRMLRLTNTVDFGECILWIQRMCRWNIFRRYDVYL